MWVAGATFLSSFFFYFQRKVHCWGLKCGQNKKLNPKCSLTNHSVKPCTSSKIIIKQTSEKLFYLYLIDLLFHFIIFSSFLFSVGSAKNIFDIWLFFKVIEYIMFRSRIGMGDMDKSNKKVTNERYECLPKNGNFFLFFHLQAEEPTLEIVL